MSDTLSFKPANTLLEVRKGQPLLKNLLGVQFQGAISGEPNVIVPARMSKHQYRSP